jgi:hypothetical protein
MCEPEFPMSDLGHEPLNLKQRIDTFYEFLPSRFNAIVGRGTWTFDDLIDHVASSIRENEIDARQWENWLCFPGTETPDSFNAIRIAVGYFIEALYAEKASGKKRTAATLVEDQAASALLKDAALLRDKAIASLLKAHYYIGMVDVYGALARNAKKGGKKIRDKYHRLAKAATAVAENLVGKHKGASTYMGIALAIARDPSVIAANAALGENAVVDLSTTLAGWAAADTTRPDFRNTILRVQNACKAQGKLKASP